jgi:hypothetical protein
LRKATISFMSFCPSVRMEQLGSHWTDFDETLYFRRFGKSVQKIQVSLKFDKNNGYFTRRRFDIFDDISLNSSYNEKGLGISCRENETTRFILSNFFPKIAPYMR